MLNMDSPGVSLINKITNILILNLLVILTSIPIITIGASLTAMHSVLYKMMKNEEGYLLKDYLDAFKQNFKKATALWLIMFAVLFVIVMDIWFVYSNIRHVPGWMIGTSTIASIILLMIMMYIFPLQAHFENTVKNTIKNAATVMILNLPRSILMFLVYLTPVIAIALTYSAIVAVFFCGFTLPAYAACFLYRKVFERIS